MRSLPVVEREIRSAARQPRTWWRRFFTVAAAFGFFAFAFIVASSWAGPSRIGNDIFTGLSVFGMIYALLAGPLATADCLGRERRDGTLGLLFLTNLSARDVVLGKMAAASFDMLLGLAAALPFMALPFLLGGVMFSTFGYVGAALLNVMLMSLAFGAFASSVFSSARAALALSIGVLAFLTLGLPLLGEWIGNLSFGHPDAPYFYILCPIYTLDRAWNTGMSGPGRPFWLSMGALHLFAWIFLALACIRTSRLWRDLPASPRRERWIRLWEKWKRGKVGSRTTWKNKMLERNPVAWLEGRDRLQSIVLGSIVLITVAMWTVCLFVDYRGTLDDEAIILFAFIAHAILCLWIAIQAPRRVGDDRQSGALELLLCTPLQPPRIIAGIMRILRGRFGAALLVLMLLDIALVASYVGLRLDRMWWRDDLVELALFGAIVCPVQAYAFARVGIYQGLVQSNALRATFMLIWKLWVLPYICFIFWIVIYEEYLRRWLAWSSSDLVAYGSWAGFHISLCLLFLAHAFWHLHHNFRTFAATPRVPLWKRLFHRLAFCWSPKRRDPEAIRSEAAARYF